MLPLPPRRPPDVVIGAPGDPYMRRWWLIPRNPILNVYLHEICRDDADVPHDHPWPSLSFLIRGRLGEWFAVPNGQCHREIRRWRPVWRGSRFAHRLVLPGRESAWTIFITGPRLREWGFLCPRGWVHWKEFTAPGAPGQIGRGCGEDQS